MKCTYCKAQNTEDCIFCPNCGKPTGSAGEIVLVPGVKPGAAHSSIVSVEISQIDVVCGTPSTPCDPLLERDRSSPIGSMQSMPRQPDIASPLTAQLARAHLCRQRKNWTEATELCIEVLRKDPADPAAHSLLGDIYRDQNRLDEAVRWYRMALELSPNPFDQANLQQLERQIIGRDLKFGSGKAGTQAGLGSITGSLAGGTGALMGVSPQKWLKGITVSALVFVSLFVVYLLMLPTRKVGPIPQAISSDALASGALAGSNELPPARPGGPVSLPAGEQQGQNTSVGRVAGMGLPPDLGTATAPPMQQQTGANAMNTLGVGPAPVQQVAPLAPGSTVRSGQVGMMAPTAPHEHNNSLMGGMQPAGVSTDHGVATIQLIAPNASPSREVIVRNAYRAARTIFGNDNTLQRADVIVHADTIDGAPLFSADVDRASAMAADPDTDDVSALLGRMHVH